MSNKVETELLPWVVKLYDRADGVRGHYCVGRWNPAGYHEFWSRNKFCSAGEVFIDKEAATAKLNLIAELVTHGKTCNCAHKKMCEDREEWLRAQIAAPPAPVENERTSADYIRTQAQRAARKIGAKIAPWLSCEVSLEGFHDTIAAIIEAEFTSLPSEPEK